VEFGFDDLSVGIREAPGAAREFVERSADYHGALPCGERRMQAVVCFQNIAIHDYKNLSLAMVRTMLEEHLDESCSFDSPMRSRPERGF